MELYCGSTPKSRTMRLSPPALRCPEQVSHRAMLAVLVDQVVGQERGVAQRHVERGVPGHRVHGRSGGSVAHFAEADLT